MSAILINDLPEPAEARRTASSATSRMGVSKDANDAVALVLQMLRDRMGMDVVFVPPYSATPQEAGATPLSIPIVLRDGRIHGQLCCLSQAMNDAGAQRDLRTLRYSARLAARLLDNIQILRELSLKAMHH